MVAIEPFNPERHWGGSLALLHLEIRHWQQTRGKKCFADIMDTQAELRDIETAYIESGGQFFVATCPRGETVGLVGLQKTEDAAILKILDVAPNFRDQGLDDRLLILAVNWSRQQQCSTIRLATGCEENDWTIYRRYGFKKDSLSAGSAEPVIEMDLSR